MEHIKKRITLIRHGEPEIYQNLSLWAAFSSQDLENFLQHYNTCKIIPPEGIPSSLKEIISNGDLFISSGLKRTHESFQMLNVRKFEQNDLFNEADLPCGIGKKIRMPAIIWLIVLRVLWRLGLTANSESYLDFVVRVGMCVDLLEKNRNRVHTVVMAHGLVNHTIKKELSRRGWKLLANKGGGGYWSYATFEKDCI